MPGRAIGLSLRAATLLGIPPEGTAQVRVAVEDGASRALARALPTTEANAVRVEAAPAAAIERETLAPLPGARQAARLREAPGGVAAPGIVAGTLALPPDPLPEQVVQHAPQPGRLVVDAGSFFRRDLAQRQASRIGAHVEAFGEGRRPQYRVRLGPFADAAAADRAVAAVLAAGLPEVALVVE